MRACGVLLLASMLMSAAVPGRAASPTAVIGELSGPVSVLLDGLEPWVAGRKGMDLTPGSEIRTRAGASAVVVFFDDSKIKLGPNASFTLEQSGASKIGLYLGIGRLDAWVKKLAGRSFQVRTPTSVASVRGTNFAVLLSNNNDVQVSVFSGSVMVMDNFGSSFMIGTGQRVDANAGRGLDRPVALPAKTEKPAEPDVVFKALTAKALGRDGKGERGQRGANPGNKPPPPGTKPPVGPNGEPLEPLLGPDGEPLPPPVGPDGEPLPPPLGPDGQPLPPPPDGEPPPPPPPDQIYLDGYTPPPLPPPPNINQDINIISPSAPPPPPP